MTLRQLRSHMEHTRFVNQVMTAPLGDAPRHRDPLPRPARRVARAPRRSRPARAARLVVVASGDAPAPPSPSDVAGAVAAWKGTHK